MKEFHGFARQAWFPTPLGAISGFAAPGQLADSDLFWDRVVSAGIADNADVANGLVFPFRPYAW